MCPSLWCHIDFKAQKLPYPPPVLPPPPPHTPLTPLPALAPFIWGYRHSRWSICVFAAAVNFLAGGASGSGNCGSDWYSETWPGAVGLISQVRWVAKWGMRGSELWQRQVFATWQRHNTWHTRSGEHNKLAGVSYKYLTFCLAGLLIKLLLIKWH